jgi:hypothetical protein
LCGWDAVGIELAGDLAQAPARGVRRLDSFDHVFGNLARAASERRCRTRAAGPPTFSEESFEFVDPDQPCAPGISIVSTCGTTRRTKVERLTPSASAAWLRVYASRSTPGAGRMTVRGSTAEGVSDGRAVPSPAVFDDEVV